MTTQSGSAPILSRTATRSAWIVVVGVILLTAALRWHLLDVPLERDEGEYAYVARLLLDGVPPYSAAYGMKLPGVHAAYAAVLAVFGASARGIHLGLLCVNALTTVLVFLLGRRLLGSYAGAVSAAAFATLTVGQAIQGAFANAEHFVLPFAVAGLLAIVDGTDRRRLGSVAAGGLLLGAAVLMKQHAVAFVAIGAAVVALAGDRERAGGRRRTALALAVLGGAVAAPYALTCLVLWRLGVLDAFWFWTVRYAATYTRQVAWHDALARFRDGVGPVASDAPGLWLLAGVGLALVVVLREGRPRRSFVLLLALGSLAAIAPGFHFRPHYVVLLAPALALAIGTGARLTAGRLTASIGPAAAQAIAALLVTVAIGQSLWVQREPLFRLTPAELSRRTYGTNPFAESPEIAEIVRAHTDPDDRVAILGSEPQILFYADRRSPTGHLYTYPLMERQPFALDMQHEMIREIEAGRPRAIVLVRIDVSWLRTADSPTAIFEWSQRYLADFVPVAAVQLLPDGSRRYEGAELARLDRNASDCVVVFVRRR